VGFRIDNASREGLYEISHEQFVCVEFVCVEFVCVRVLMNTVIYM